jgi:hypothetical protein
MSRFTMQNLKSIEDVREYIREIVRDDDKNWYEVDRGLIEAALGRWKQIEGDIKC